MYYNAVLCAENIGALRTLVVRC